jgi:hypothetical protein
VGRSNHGPTSVGAVFHADGTVTELPVPTWQPADQHLYSGALAVNDGGVVVGTAVAFFEDPDGHFVWVNDPYLWTAAGGYVRLPHLTDDTSYTEPIAINSSGVIVGHSMKNNAMTAVWWDAAGAIHEIGTVAGDSESVLLSINDAGTAVGESGSRAAIWTPDGGMRRLPDFGYHSKALAINASGWVIGNADFAPYETHVVAWDPQGNLYDLNAMLVEQDAFWMSEAVGVSDSGDFVVYGQALDGSGGTTAIVRF